MARPKNPDKKRSNGDGGVWQLETGRWRWEIVLGYATKPDGTRSRKTKSGTAKNETEAKKALTLARADKERGMLATPDKVTVSEYLKNWLEGRAPRLAKNSVTSYAGLIRLHIAPNIGEKRLQALKPLDLRNLYTLLLEKGLSGRSVRYVHGLLYSAFKEAVRLEITYRNVAEAVTPEVPTENRNAKASQAWTADEAVKFLSVARGDTLYALFYIMLTLGLRRGEACGLRWQDINLEQRKLRINQTIVTIGGKATPSAPKTKGSARPLGIPPELFEVLRLHRAMQAQLHLENGVSPETDYVFTTRTGTAIHPDNVNRSLERLCKVAGVRQVRVHDLRHTYASLARRAGVSLEMVSEKLGHARASFTGDVYVHTFDDQHDAATLNLSELLASRPRAAVA